MWPEDVPSAARDVDPLASEGGSCNPDFALHFLARWRDRESLPMISVMVVFEEEDSRFSSVG